MNAPTIAARAVALLALSVALAAGTLAATAQEGASRRVADSADRRHRGEPGRPEDTVRQGQGDLPREVPAVPRRRREGRRLRGRPRSPAAGSHRRRARRAQPRRRRLLQGVERPPEAQDARLQHRPLARGGLDGGALRQDPAEVMGWVRRSARRLGRRYRTARAQGATGAGLVRSRGAGRVLLRGGARAGIRHGVTRPTSGARSDGTCARRDRALARLPAPEVLPQLVLPERPVVAAGRPPVVQRCGMCLVPRMCARCSDGPLSS